MATGGSKCHSVTAEMAGRLEQSRRGQDEGYRERRTLLLSRTGEETLACPPPPESCPQSLTSGPPRDPCLLRGRFAERQAHDSALNTEEVRAKSSCNARVGEDTGVVLQLVPGAGRPQLRIHTLRGAAVSHVPGNTVHVPSVDEAACIIVRFLQLAEWQNSRGHQKGEDSPEGVLGILGHPWISFGRFKSPSVPDGPLGRGWDRWPSSGPPITGPV